MIKLFNTKKLNTIAQTSNSIKKSKKDGLNKNLNGLSQDTFELRSGKKSAFSGKSAKSLQDILNKLNDKNNGLEKGLIKDKRLGKSSDKAPDRYIQMINGNQGLNSQNPEDVNQAKNLIIEIGKRYNPEKNDKLTTDIDEALMPQVIVPLLLSNQRPKISTGIEIIKEISSNNWQFAKKNIDELNRFTTPFYTLGNQSFDSDAVILTKRQAIKAIGDIAEEQPVVAESSTNKLLAIIDRKSLEATLREDVLLTAVDSMYKIAKANEGIKERIKNTPEIKDALMTICKSGSNYTEHAINKLKLFASLYGRESKAYAGAAKHAEELTREAQKGEIFGDAEARFKQQQVAKIERLQAQLATTHPQHPLREEVEKQLRQLQNQVEEAKKVEGEARANKSPEVSSED